MICVDDSRLPTLSVRIAEPAESRVTGQWLDILQRRCLLPGIWPNVDFRGGVVYRVQDENLWPRSLAFFLTHGPRPIGQGDFAAQRCPLLGGLGLFFRLRFRPNKNIGVRIATTGVGVKDVGTYLSADSFGTIKWQKVAKTVRGFV